MTMGERIAVLRKGRGFTQEQLAERLSVTRQSVSKWELDQAIPEIGYAVALCNLFEVSLDYLVRGIEPTPTTVDVTTVPAEDSGSQKEIFSSPKPLKVKDYVILFGAILLLTGMLGVYLIPAIYAVSFEAGITVMLLLFGIVTPLPAVYLATCRWWYANCRYALRHLWTVASITVIMGNFLLISGIMLCLKCFSDDYAFWSMGWAEVWSQALTAELFTLALLLPLLLRFHEKKWLCWIFFALSPGVYATGLVADFGLTNLIPSAGKYGALSNLAIRLAVMLLLALSQLVIYKRLKCLPVSSEKTNHPLSVWVLWGLPVVCGVAIPSIGGGLYYAMALAGLSRAYLPLAAVSLPAWLLFFSCGKSYPTYRGALIEAGRVTGLFLPFLLAGHMGITYLTEYLLSFGGPMPELNGGSYLLLSVASIFMGEIVTLPALTALRRHSWACGLVWGLLVLVTVVASIWLPDALYRL